MNSPGGYIYVLHGDDAFARDETLLALKERMRALPAGEHNMTELSPADSTVAALRMAADAIPFLADRRMVIARGLLGRLQGRGGAPRRARASRKSAAAPTEPDEYQSLLAYLPDVPQTTSIAFVEDATINPDSVVEVVPRGRAFVRAFARPRPDEVPTWIRNRARTLDVEIDESAVRELAILGGDDLRRLDSELRKLGVYAAGRSITRADVRELVVSRDLSVWTLLDGLAERRPEKALRALRGLFAQGEDASALMMRDTAPMYRRLLMAKELSLLDRRARAGWEPADLGLNPRTLSRTTEQADRFDRAELERALDWLLELDRQIKAGEAEPETSFELLVVRLCTRLAAS